MSINTTPDQYIELSRARRTAISEQIRDLRYEYDDLLAEEVRVRVETINLGKE